MVRSGRRTRSGRTGWEAVRTADQRRPAVLSAGEGGGGVGAVK